MNQKKGMMLLLLLMLSSSLTAFMNKPVINKAAIIIKFSDYEVYGDNITITSNETILQAISTLYPVRFSNNTLCIRAECGNWTIINNKGENKSINEPVMSGQYYITRNDKT